eukprot:6997484-Pyramimonas_sp.AAC.1
MCRHIWRRGAPLWHRSGARRQSTRPDPRARFLDLSTRAGETLRALSSPSGGGGGARGNAGSALEGFRGSRL